MRSVAEREVRVRIAAHVEAIRVVEMAWIAIGGRQGNGDELALPERLPPQFEILDNGAIGELDRTFEPQEFVDRRRHERRVVLQPFAFAGIAEKRHHRVPDQVGRGLMAGGEDQDAQRQQAVFVESASIFFGLDHGGDQVILGLRPPIG